jgi:hypothetical protein
MPVGARLGNEGFSSTKPGVGGNVFSAGNNNQSNFRYQAVRF